MPPRAQELSATPPPPLAGEGWGEGGWRSVRHAAASRAKNLRKNQTNAETVFWHAVKAKRFYGYKFRRQYPIGPYFADFACIEQKLVVEIDGGQHCDNGQDDVRTAFIEQQGFALLRFWNNDILENTDGVLSKLLTHLRGPHAPQ